MVATPLVGDYVAIGKEVLDALRKNADIAPRAALWFFEPDAAEWRLIIATPYVERHGPVQAFTKVRGILSRSNLLDRLPLSRIVLTSPKSSFLNKLAKTVGVVKYPSDTQREIYDFQSPGAIVDGAHVYQLEPLPGAQSATTCTSATYWG